MVRIAAATISAEPLGTWASTLRRKCTRHLCQLAPIRIASIAARSPEWASEITSATPARPRDFSDTIASMLGRQLPKVESMLPVLSGGQL
jgi:hypothetical protein